MPACARKEIVRQGEPGIYHVWSRCVRRAFLLGTDPLTGKDYNHRREWVIQRLKLLVASFAIDIGFSAILSNHFHLVLRTDPRLVKRMGDQEVARRWLRVFPGKRVLDGIWIEPTEKQVQTLARDKAKLKKIRKRLSSVSWFMSALSEYIARRANLEDDCTGRFFQGRFACREITSEGALLVCGMYVDLNQIRAGEARTPEESTHCSVALRLAADVESRSEDPNHVAPDQWLAPLTLQSDQLDEVPCTSSCRASDKGLLPISLAEYASLLDWTGREVSGDKQGIIPPGLAPILERLNLEASEVPATVATFPRWFPRLVGSAEDMATRAAEVGRRWLHGVRHANRVFR
jgi:hypothetical protein